MENGGTSKSKSKSISKRIETPQLPEAMMQHILSFMSGKESAQTTILSKSWYNAWLTRPTLHFDVRDFKNRQPHEFVEFTTKTIQRYKHLNLKIHSFTLQTQSRSKKWSIDLPVLANQLILDAIIIGASDLNLEFLPSTFVLPQEVLTSPSLLRLSLKWCEIDGNVCCPNLKSLRLDRVVLKNDDMLRDIFSSCISIEELSLLNSVDSSVTTNLWLSAKNLCKLHELRRLFLDGVKVYSSFFNDFDSRFPCLKDLTLVRCHGYSRIEIASSSLQRISFVQPKKFFRANFNVPNLACFSYSGVVIPYISIDATQWESCVFIKRYRSHTSFWYLNLQELLRQLSSSRITLSLSILASSSWCADLVANERDIELVREPVGVEDLIIEAPFELGRDLLVGSFGICRPKFVTQYWLPESCNGNNDYLEEIWEILMDQVTTPNCGIPDQGIFGRFGLKKVNVEVYEEILSEWRHVLLKEPQLEAATSNKRRIHFKLKW